MLEEDAELGILALQKGLITQQVLDECLAEVIDRGCSLADSLQRRGVLNPGQIESLRAEVRPRESASGGDRPPAREADGQWGEPDPAQARTVVGGMPAPAMLAAKDPNNCFGRFIRVSEMGQGALGPVWRGWDTQAGRWVAMKFPPDSGDRNGTERFFRSLNAVCLLNHPGIVSTYEVGSKKDGGLDRLFVALELAEGETLDKVRAAGLEVRRAAEIIRDAAQAVAFANDKGIIHKDIKPKNIIVDAEGRVRVMDFGLTATAGTLNAGEDTKLSRSITVHGTPSYMPPEQALGRTGDIQKRSDVYSLGATLYFLVTGRPPFDGVNPMKTALSVVREALVPPSQINPDVPSDLERLIVRAMAKDPIRRYESAKALADDLDRFLGSGRVLTDDQLRFTQGLSALFAGRLEEAIHMFKELLRMESTDQNAVMGHDAVVRKLEEGENGLSLAIERQQKNYDIRTNRGVYRFAKAIMQSLDGQDPSASCKTAMEDFVTSASLRPEYTPARVNRANVLIFGGRWARDSGKDVGSIFDMALRDLNAAIQFDETCSPAYHNRGIVRFYIARNVQKGGQDPEPEYGKAVEDFSRAAELEPTYAYIFKDLGVVKVALAKFMLAKGQKVKNLFLEAISHLDSACQLNPSIYGAFYERGQAYFAIKEWRKAIGDFRRCMELDPTRDRKVQALIEEAMKHQSRGS